MSTEYDEIAKIARASLLPDFFAVRIDEEHLFGKLQEMIAKITLPKPVPQLDAIKRIAAATDSAAAFMQQINEANLYTVTRELISKIKVA
ncbi:MAG: hypothetical protein H6707_04635 [Deltaproteobacteria bacterium]|nr:hypothetical protein [Deltaproteobacteria bacterium]